MSGEEELVWSGERSGDRDQLAPLLLDDVYFLGSLRGGGEGDARIVRRGGSRRLSILRGGGNAVLLEEEGRRLLGDILIGLRIFLVWLVRWEEGLVEVSFLLAGGDHRAGAGGLSRRAGGGVGEWWCRAGGDRPLLPGGGDLFSRLAGGEDPPSRLLGGDLSRLEGGGGFFCLPGGGPLSRLPEGGERELRG